MVDFSDPDTLDPVDQLDLCILAYQLHSQTLVWPLDPYSEEMAQGRWSGLRRYSSDDDARLAFMKGIGPVTVASQHPARGQGTMRGVPDVPGGAAAGWLWSEKLDPILYDYSRISPFRPGFTRQNRQGGGMIVYEAPDRITSRISEVWLASYSADHGPHHPQKHLNIHRIEPLAAPAGAAGDTLYCFEGATGVDKQGGASWSLMGFVLERKRREEGHYDIYIVFRGSRSGELRKYNSLKGRGNPDWKTDLGFGQGSLAFSGFRFEPDEWVAGSGLDAELRESIKLHRGFSRAIRTMALPIMEILSKISRDNGGAPNTVHVAGHSLGGALAQAFVSCLLLGHYAQADNRRAFSDNWKKALDEPNLITFGAPAIGNVEFANSLHQKLPPAQRYLIGGMSGDVVAKAPGGHIGQKIKLRSSAHLKEAHEPLQIRIDLDAHLKRQGGYLAERRNGNEAGVCTPWKSYHFKKNSEGCPPAAALSDAFSREPFTMPPFKEDFLLYLQALTTAFESEKVIGFGKRTDSEALHNAIEMIRNLNAESSIDNIRDAYEALSSLAISNTQSMQEMFRLWLVLALAQVTSNKISVSCEDCVAFLNDRR